MRAARACSSAPQPFLKVTLTAERRLRPGVDGAGCAERNCLKVTLTAERRLRPTSDESSLLTCSLKVTLTAERRLRHAESGRNPDFVAPQSHLDSRKAIETRDGARPFAIAVASLKVTLTAERRLRLSQSRRSLFTASSSKSP